MTKKILMSPCVVLLFVFAIGCSTTGEKTRFKTLSTSRDVKHDKVKQIDSNLDVPLWASNLKAYEEELLKNRTSDSDKYKYYSAQSTVATMGSIETCYKMAAMNIKSGISGTVNEAFTAELGTTREGDSEKPMAGYVKDTMASVTKNVFSGLEKEDTFYKQVMDVTTENVSYQCFVLYSIKKTALENLKLGRAAENNIPKEAKENIERALESTREMLIKQ
jgi:hypothetical protein